MIFPKNRYLSRFSSARLLLAVAVCFFVPAASPADLRIEFEAETSNAIFRDGAGPQLLAPEPLLLWNDAEPRSWEPAGDQWTANFATGLKATITRAPKGEFGEPVFRIELRNSGSETVTGVLSPVFARWSRNAKGIRAASPRYMVITSRRIIVGELGEHKSWSPGAEFEHDVFATVPSSENRSQLTAVLLMNPHDLQPEHDQITLRSGRSCHYELHLDVVGGTRNAALREIYRVRGGYRVHPERYRFDAYNDQTLSWAKNMVATWLSWAWDESVIDPRTGAYRLTESLFEAKRRFGGYDAYIFWPFWPRAGFDDRSQFDHYRDMPGGIDGLRTEIERMHTTGVHAFISYCHWSESDRDRSEPAMNRSYQNFADLACQVDADGALMDLMSKTPTEILNRAERCGQKLVPYNEGDPTWSDTQTNLLGRIHNDLAMPEFNLKKYMLPHHPQLRVCEPGNTGKRLRNDFILSFFNGHGVEINTMFPQNNPANEPDWQILSRALDILRANRANFRSPAWEPLIPSLDSSVWINEWPTPTATLYTLCGTSTAGHHGPLLTTIHRDDTHYVDLWRYRSLACERKDNNDVLSYNVDGYTPGLGSPKGSGDYSPGCIGAFRKELKAWLDFEMLHIQIAHSTPGATVEVWLGTVDPATEPVRMPAKADLELDLYRQFKRHTNDAVIVRLLDRDQQLQDVSIVPDEAVRFFRIDKPEPTKPEPANAVPAGMVRIPGGHFRYIVTNSRPAVDFPFAYPPFQPTYAYLPGVDPINREAHLSPFWIDVFPVTNAEFARFVKASGYHPQHIANFLKHFVDGRVPHGLEDHPVVYVSYDDAKAYGAWANKRLPTEEEWQFAAAAGDGRQWPWGENWDPAQVNPGGKGTDPVNAHERDASPYGVRDLVGNVWQWTASLMDNGRHQTVMLRGGSWYRPPEGRWWVPGGPRKITENYPLPLDGPAMDRLATVGFRCVKDVASERN
jgi:iron(II)-dependent oxidoreductase